jgi:hypothetical protein
MPLFDRALIPQDVYSSESLDRLDALLKDLQNRLVTKIVVPEPETRFRSSNIGRALSQAFIRRCIEQAEATALLCHARHWISAMTVARALIETVAAFHHYGTKLQTATEKGDLAEIHEMIRVTAFATRLDGLIDRAGTQAVKATNILTQVGKLKAFRNDISEDYEHLCEYAHPNSFGTYLFYADDDRAADIIRFRAEGWIGDDLFEWIGAACSMLAVAIDTAETVELLLQRISEIGRAGWVANPHQ